MSNLVLTNGRSPSNKDGDLITRKQAREMVESAVMAERVENEKMVKWYMNQIPELVARMLGDALAVNGLVMKGPEPVTSPPLSEVPENAALDPTASDGTGYSCGQVGDRE